MSSCVALVLHVQASGRLGRVQGCQAVLVREQRGHLQDRLRATARGRGKQKHVHSETTLRTTGTCVRVSLTCISV